MTVRGALKDTDGAMIAGVRRPPLVSREQVVAQAIELLVAEKNLQEAEQQLDFYLTDLRLTQPERSWAVGEKSRLLLSPRRRRPRSPGRRA